MRNCIIKYFILNLMILCAEVVASQTSYGNQQFTKGSIEFIDSVMTEDFVVFKAFHDLRAISPDEDSHSKTCYFTDYNGRPNWKPIVVKNSAVKKGELICVEYSETKINQDIRYLVEVFRFEKYEEQGDTLKIARAEDLSDLSDELCGGGKRLRFVHDDIMYMANWFHGHIAERELYYPSTAVLFDGYREVNDIKSYGFVIIYTSEDYTQLPTRYRRMIL